MTTNTSLLRQPIRVEKPASQPDATTPPEHAKLSRREFLTYAWGTALVLLTAESAATSYLFLYPRFRAGEFGGKFGLGTAAVLPDVNAAPLPNSDGKFWLVNTEEGPKAIYMVCTHLGCLYKWSEQHERFECPCHGSTFARNGDYICGPAPRSLDQFVVEVKANDELIATTTEAETVIVPPSIKGTEVQLVVNTGKRLMGKPKNLSPVNDQGVCNA